MDFSDSLVHLRPFSTLYPVVCTYIQRIEDLSSEEDDEDEPSRKKLKPAPGKKTRGRVKIPMEYIKNKLRRYTTFSKRKSNIMKKAYELSTLTGTQVRTYSRSTYVVG